MRALVFDKSLVFQPRYPEPPAAAGDTLLRVVGPAQEARAGQLLKVRIRSAKLFPAQ